MKADTMTVAARKDEPETQAEDERRRPYSTPKLACYGAFTELTRGGALSGSDIGVPGNRP